MSWFLVCIEINWTRLARLLRSVAIVRVTWETLMSFYSTTWKSFFFSSWDIHGLRDVLIFLYCSVCCDSFCPVETYWLPVSLKLQVKLYFSFLPNTLTTHSRELPRIYWFGDFKDPGQVPPDHMEELLSWTLVQQPSHPMKSSALQIPSYFKRRQGLGRGKPLASI